MLKRALVWILLSASSTFVLARDLQVVARHEQAGKPLVERSLNALTHAGFNPSITFMPWNRAMDQTLKGGADILLGAYFTEERANNLHYTQDIGRVEVVIVKRQDTEIDPSALPQSLKGHTIGLLRGGRIGGAYDAFLKQSNQIEYVTDSQQNLDKLLKGRIDLFFEKHSIAHHNRQKLLDQGQDSIDIVLPAAVSNDVFNVVSKKTEDFEAVASRFNQAWNDLGYETILE